MLGVSLLVSHEQELQGEIQEYISIIDTEWIIDKYQDLWKAQNTGFCFDE